jgi:Fe-S-cluster containining protein
LSFHAAYACRHSGACCRAGWPIPFDPDEAARVERLPLQATPRFVRPVRMDGVAFAATSPAGACAFFESENHLCAIHRVGGPSALPLTCRRFPRIVLQDPRGTFVSLSHFCPTAAGLLFDAPGPDVIVEAPASLVGDDPLDGLDATETWAPLLRPGVLMDWDGYAAWERRAIGVLMGNNRAPWQALDLIDDATRAIAEWSADSEPTLSTCVEDAFDGARSTGPTRLVPDGALFTLVARAVPPTLDAPAVPDAPSVPPARHAIEDYSSTVNRWLAARLFGTWIAYQGTGLATIVGYLRAALDVLVIELTRTPSDGRPGRADVLEALRRSDYLLVHLADSQRLATLLS